MPEENDVAYRVGQLNGQITALTLLVTSLQSSLTALDTRLRQTENNTTKLMVQMSIVAFVSGGIGSLIISLFQFLIFKKV